MLRFFLAEATLNDSLRRNMTDSVMIEDVWRFLNQNSLPIFMLGTLILVWRNYLHWKKDQSVKSDTQPLPSLEQTPLVSVVVAAWNEEKWIEDHIRTFLQLNYPAKQLVLCAGGKDNTLELANNYADGKTVIVIEQEAGKGKQVALRKALPYATGEIIYLTDADCLLNDDAFTRTILPIVKGDYQVVNGTSRPLASQVTNPFVVFQWSVDYYTNLHSPKLSSGLLGRNCAVKSTALRQTGGFDAEARSGTDYTLARQLIDAGYEIYNEKKSIVETEYPETIETYYHKRSRWLRNTIVLAFRKKDYESMVPSVFTSFIGLFMLLMPLVALVLGPIIGVVWLLLLFHAVLSRLRYVYLHSDTVDISAPKVALVGILFLPLDFYISSMTLLQVIVPRWRNTWR